MCPRFFRFSRPSCYFFIPFPLLLLFFIFQGWGWLPCKVDESIVNNLQMGLKCNYYPFTPKQPKTPKILMNPTGFKKNLPASTNYSDNVSKLNDNGIQSSILVYWNSMKSNKKKKFQFQSYTILYFFFSSSRSRLALMYTHSTLVLFLLSQPVSHSPLLI